jgi:transcriptional regulator of acetoin/glycerol metabolism
MPRHTPPAASPALPAQPFFGSSAQRVALARERFFERGEHPSGLVSEAVLQSWARCHAALRSPGYAVAFDPVSRSHLRATVERNQPLLTAAREEISQLEVALAGTGCRVLLTDANGVIVHASAGRCAAAGSALRQLARVGVNLAEAHLGTNAPAVVLKTGAPTTVLGAEHYFECVRSLHCAAAPIRDGQGRLAGVLDLTAEARTFAFDAAALVGVYATVIENRLLQAGAGGQLVLQFQVGAGMLGTPLQALAGIDAQGRLAWLNGTAQKLLGHGMADATAQGTAAEGWFGASLPQLLARSAEAPFSLRLPNGLTVWLRARPPAGSAAASAAAARASTPADSAGEVAPAPATLNGLAREAIARTLAECGGNVSLAARRLGVSRGLLYRRLKACAPDRRRERRHR